MEENSFKILDAYAPMFYSDKPYYIISGGRGSGKSTQVAAYFLLKLFGEEYFRGVVSRYSAKSVKFSIYADILDLAEKWGVRSLIQFSGEEMVNPKNKNKIITHSFRIPEGTMVAKGKGLANATHLIIDEAQELPDENEYIKTIDTFRHKGAERKIFVVFNPDSKLHWLYKRFFLNGKPNPKWLDSHVFIHTTYLDNIQNLDPAKVKEWVATETTNPEYYKHHILGEWRDAYEGVVFSNWSAEYEPPYEATTTYGLDFGFSADPTACIEIKKHGSKLWLKEILYDYGLTNSDIFNALTAAGVPANAMIIADSAEPKSIEELKRLGLRNIKPAKKGPGSIISGIKHIKEHELYVDPNSQNLINELNSYVWKSNKDLPEDTNNHAMDAIRYGLSQKQRKYVLS